MIVKKVMSSPKYNILNIYHSKTYPLRATIQDHLYCFQRYSGQHCFYLNLRVNRIPWYLKKVQFDLIIFHTSFLAQRWNKAEFERLINKVRPLKQIEAVKIALPQDEFLHTDVLCDFINEFDLDYVFSVAPESEWPKIYSTVDLKQVKFFNVLTGYLDEATIARINTLAKLTQKRTVDVGYRAWRGAPWLGRHGLLKAQIADAFQEKSPSKGLTTDISTGHTFLGDEWYKFLSRCKYTFGVEGGASILDRTGTIKRKTEAYLARWPGASFEEVEAACFPNVDGSFQLFAISPRHLEACATRTCQVLVEGAYNGVLAPGRHYIELKRDFSNLDQVLDLIKQDHLRDQITENAYQDVVGSGRYTYRRFVEFIIETSLSRSKTNDESLWDRLFYLWMQLVDIFSWIRIATRSQIRKIIMNTFSKEMVMAMRGWGRGKA